MSDIRDGFKEYLRANKDNISEKTIGTYYSDSIFCETNAKDLDIDFQQILDDGIPDDLPKKLLNYLIKIGRKNPKSDTSGYINNLNSLINYNNEEKPTKKQSDNYQEDLSKIKNNHAKKKNKKEQLNNQPDKIKQRIDDLIILINDNCKNKNYEPVFYDLNTREMWRAIEKNCISKEIFINFSLNLYKLIYETTRKENPKYKKNNQEPFYIYRLPKEFLKNGTSTKHFMDIVGTLRHKYAHKEAKYNVKINEISYPEILQELLKNIKEPPDYQKLQIEILRLFENAMKFLLDSQ